MGFGEGEIYLVGIELLGKEYRDDFSYGYWLFLYGGENEIVVFFVVSEDFIDVGVQFVEGQFVVWQYECVVWQVGGQGVKVVGVEVQWVVVWFYGLDVDIGCDVGKNLIGCDEKFC